jgi:hypothetical protein
MISSSSISLCLDIRPQSPYPNHLVHHYTRQHNVGSVPMYQGHRRSSVDSPLTAQGPRPQAQSSRGRFPGPMVRGPGLTPQRSSYFGFCP